MPMNPRLLRPLARRQAPAPAFSPASITGLALWLDASDATTITETSGQVSTWQDKSGNDYHATQQTANNRPTLYDGNSNPALLNGRQALFFDGTNDTLRTPTFARSQPLTAFFACKNFLNTPLTGFVLDGGDGQRVAFYLVNQTFRIYRIYAGSAESPNSGMQGSDTVIATAVYNGNSSRLRIRGVQQFSGNFGSNGIDDGVYIGSADGTQAFFDGVIGEVLIYSGALATADIEATEAYLTARWG